MTAKSKSTLHMLCVRSGIVSRELPQEAQRLLKIYNDTAVAPEQKAIVRSELDLAIQKLEERVTSRRLREANGDSPAAEQ
jgi:hypothetical protein